MQDIPHLIVDGYNYILRRQTIPSDDDDALWRAREELIRKMIAYRGNKKIAVTIVFDGQDIRQMGNVSRPVGIRVLFSRAPQKADPLIIRLVQAASHPKSITVVTSDRSLASSLKTYGCRIWTSEELEQKFAKKERLEEYRNKYGTSMSKKEIDDWMEIFGQKKKTDRD